MSADGNDADNFGDYVGWTGDHGVTVEHVFANNLDNFWLTLRDQGVI